MYGEGISKVGEIIDIGADIDVLNKSGAWYRYNDIKLGQGKENVKKFLLDNPDLLNEIEVKIRAHYKLDGDVIENETPATDNALEDEYINKDGIIEVMEAMRGKK